MLDTSAGARPDTDAATATTPALCIIGAGIAGLNALFVASEYLKPTDRVILIDRNPVAGGMWTKTYDYVRLHQPYRMFTLGDMKWTLNKPSDYLASRQEVVDHFTHCLNIIRTRVDLIEHYGHTCLGVEEEMTPTGPKARIRFAPNDRPDQVQDLLADRAIDAIAFDIPVIPPLRLSSQAVASLSPVGIGQGELPPGDGPIVVVGAGKTGMDTVLALSRMAPDRQLSLVSGKGTLFGNRDRVLPKGIARWWKGELLLQNFADLSMRFDGTNEDEAFEYFRNKLAISPDGTGEQFFFGLLSEAESAAVAKALSQIHKDYLDDVIDTDDGPVMVMRSGARVPVPAGTAFVNCTGHVLRKETPYRPYLSEHGAVLTISPRSVIHFLSTVSSYFLSHHFFRGTLKDAPLYAMDMEAMLGKGRKVWHMTAVTVSFLNSVVLVHTLPFKVLDRCGLNLDLWFPMPRRALWLLNMKRNRQKYEDHCRRSLDRVRERYGVIGGP